MMQGQRLLRLYFILYLVSILRLSKVRVAINKSFLPGLSVDQHVFESLQGSLWKAISLDLDRQSLNKVVGDSTSPTSARGD
ncbi:hypothetical protein RHMOL_Rhmol02G0300700 [Rhododendron molle]|uniref:Uncharacterized protein n=1 Tax=Rhododendron molle TaxID=49168 RepID=A0ACC0PVX4_RHOML|nr:hypothetical protein RHMOL_Rhmol02G0300700 [Rhododendron molle]